MEAIARSLQSGSRARKFGALLAAAAFFVLTTLLLPLHFVLETAQDEERVLALLSKERLDSLGTRAIVLELQKRETVLALRGSPLELSTADLQHIVHDTFTADDFLAKAAETHGALLRYVRHTPPDSIFFISLRREKPILLDNSSARLHAKFDALKPCGVQSHFGIAWDVLHDKLTGMTEEELLGHFPDCRPPDFIASKVHAGIDRRTEAMKTTGADSVRMLPSRHGDDHPTHRAVVLGLRAADRVLVKGAGFLFLVLATLLGVSMILNRHESSGNLRGIAIMLVLVGAILALEGLLLRSHVGRPGTLQQVFADALDRMIETRRAWFHVAFYAIEKVVTDAGSRIVWVGAVLGGAGVALVLTRRPRRRGGSIQT